MIMKILFLLLAIPMIGFGQNVNIPDANFKAYLVKNKVINKNGQAKGEKHGMHKLTEPQAVEIKSSTKMEIAKYKLVKLAPLKV